MTRLPSGRKIRIAAALIVAAGLGACAVAIFSDPLGVGTEGTGRGLGRMQIALLVAGLLTAAVGGTALARPQIVSPLISWWGKAEPEDRPIRAAGLVVLVAGLIACILAIASDVLGLGTEGSGGQFGSKQIALLVAGAIALTVGVLLLGRPQVVSGRVAWKELRRRVNWKALRRRLDWHALRRSLRDASQAGEGSMSAGKMAKLVLVARRVLLPLIAVAIVINVIQFKKIDDGRASNYRALPSYDTNDLFEIGISHSPSTRVRVAPFHYLGELFPKSIVVVPDGGVDTYYPLESAAVGFGEATSVKEASYDPEDFLNLAELKQYRIDTATFAPDDRWLTEIRAARKEAEREAARAAERLSRVRRDYQDGRLEADDWQEQRTQLSEERSAAEGDVSRLLEQEGILRRYPTVETIDERVSFYVDRLPSGIVLVLTPKGPPERYGPMAFVDTSVLDAEGIPIPEFR
jgi:hypothetical protein